MTTNRRPPWEMFSAPETGAEAVAHIEATRSPSTPSPSADDADADAPLITWRWHMGGRQRRDRSHPSVIDRLAPSSIDRRRHDAARLGQSYIRAYALLELPRRISPGLLAPMMRLPGVRTALVNNPVPPARAKELLMSRARQMRVALHQQQDEADPDETLAEQDLRRHLTALVVERSVHHLFGLYFTVAGADDGELAERSRAFEDACHSAGLRIVRCDYQHWEGALTTAPLGHDLLRYLNETDSATLARLFPSSPALLRGGQGTPILYGLRVEGHGGSDTSSGTPILVDRFAVASPHEAVIAATGGGKTYYISWRLLQRFAHGHCAIVVIDPKDQEYRHLIESTLGGTYLVLSEQAKVHLNPLALPPRSVAKDERICALQIDVRAERAALLKQIVVGEAQARGLPLSGRAEAQLEEAVLACYIARGCTHDPTTWHAEAPVISDVVAVLRERQADDTLISHMALFTDGRLGRLIDAPGDLMWHPSRLRPDVAVLGIDLSAFVTGNDQTLRRVLPVLIGNACITLALANAGRVPMELILDEAWTLLQTGAGAAVLEVVGRIGRTLKVGATVITQQVREFLERPAGEGVVANTAGQAFLANCETVLLLRQLRPPRGQSAPEDNPIVMAARHFGLTPGEAHWLAQCRRTERGSTGLLIVGREPVPLLIPRVPEPLHGIITGQTNNLLLEAHDASS